MTLLLMIVMAGPTIDAPGQALLVGDRIYLSQPKSNRVLVLNHQLAVIQSIGETGEGPQGLQNPYGLFLIDGAVWVYNRMTHRFSIIEEGRIRGTAVAPRFGTPIAQSTDGATFVFSDQEAIYRVVTRKGGEWETRAFGGWSSHREIHRFYRNDLALPFDGQVLWAEGLDLDIYLARGNTHNLVIDLPDASETPIPKKFDAFRALLPHLSRWHQPGCFTFRHSDGSIRAAATVHAPVDVEPSFRVLIIDQTGALMESKAQSNYPLLFEPESARFLVTDDETLAWRSGEPQ